MGDKYSEYQNFVITYDQFYDSSGYNLNSANVPLDYTSVGPYYGEYGLGPFENDPEDVGIVNPINNGNLNIFFNIQLNVPKVKPKKLIIRNINSSLNTIGGYLYELSCQSLFKYPIQFLDSLSTFTIYEENMTKDLNSANPIFNLKRLSGSFPLQREDTSWPYIINSSLSFTLEYQYF